MPSALSFSDAVLRKGIRQAMGRSMYNSQVLVQGRFIDVKRLDSQLISNRLPYAVDLPPSAQWANTMGYEAGVTVQRLSRETDEEIILELPLDFFSTHSEQMLWARRGEYEGQASALDACSTKMAQVIQNFRRKATVHDLVRRALASAGGGSRGTYPTMNSDISGGTDAFLTAAAAAELMKLFPGDYRSRLAGWLVHSNVYWYLRSLATLDQASTHDAAIQFVQSAHSGAGALYLHGVEVFENNDDDSTETQDGSSVTVYGTRIPGSPVKYRSLLVTKEALTERWELSPNFRRIESTPVPAGTPGYPAAGMSSGTHVIGTFYRVGVVPLPGSFMDRMGVAMVIHD